MLDQEARSTAPIFKRLYMVHFLSSRIQRIRLYLLFQAGNGAEGGKKQSIKIRRKQHVSKDKHGLSGPDQSDDESDG